MYAGCVPRRSSDRIICKIFQFRIESFSIQPQRFLLQSGMVTCWHTGTKNRTSAKLTVAASRTATLDRWDDTRRIITVLWFWQHRQRPRRFNQATRHLITRTVERQQLPIPVYHQQRQAVGCNFSFHINYDSSMINTKKPFYPQLNVISVLFLSPRNHWRRCELPTWCHLHTISDKWRWQHNNCNQF